MAKHVYCSLSYFLVTRSIFVYSKRGQHLPSWLHSREWKISDQEPWRKIQSGRNYFTLEAFSLESWAMLHSLCSGNHLILKCLSEFNQRACNRFIENRFNGTFVSSYDSHVSKIEMWHVRSAYCAIQSQAAAWCYCSAFNTLDIFYKHLFFQNAFWTLKWSALW